MNECIGSSLPLKLPKILDDIDFDARLTALGPFENQPHIAVAVSGGVDSLCLVLLASRWATSRGGRVTALSVDHGLRAESREELEQVSKWLQPKGIDHHILIWKERKPVAGLQAAARDARYKLLTEWCSNACVLHLLVAHTLDDQAETFLLRLKKGSGAEGLAAMSEIRETSSIRILRPLLSIPKVALQAFLEREGQDWVEDPSNRDMAFARVRIRQTLIDGSYDKEASAQSATRFGRIRIALETSIYQLLASSVQIYPAGFAVLDPKEIFNSPEEFGIRALGRVVSTIGGKSYAPRMEKIERLYKDLSNINSIDTDVPSRTLSGCRFIVGNGSYLGKILICREVRGLPKPMSIKSSMKLIWDSRFQIQFISSIKSGSRLAALGDTGLLNTVSCGIDFHDFGIPSLARLALPALFDEKGVYSIPHLGFLRLGASPGIKNIKFYPSNSISKAGFFLR
jgi:tRNA(Ile)-lysidine synthase